jgi:hypothetical protein
MSIQLPTKQYDSESVEIITHNRTTFSIPQSSTFKHTKQHDFDMTSHINMHSSEKKKQLIGTTAYRTSLSL